MERRSKRRLPVKRLSSSPWLSEEGTSVCVYLFVLLFCNSGIMPGIGPPLFRWPFLNDLSFMGNTLPKVT